MTDRICSVDECGRFVHARGVCQTHYSWIRNRGGLIPPTRRVPAHGGATQYMTYHCRCDRCRAWHRSYTAALRVRNAEAIKASRLARVGAAPCARCRVNPSELSSGYCRGCVAGNRHNLSAVDYDRMLAEQGGVCAICGNPERAVTKSGVLKKLSIDHDHGTGAVRGLLCRTCNSGIGQFYDNSDFLERAAAYLRGESPYLT